MSSKTRKTARNKLKTIRKSHYARNTKFNKGIPNTKKKLLAKRKVKNVRSDGLIYYTKERNWKRSWGEVAH